jgi:BirA family biotin operon repressor/biotin-[acetyl-CoA-carboxylase] ligase
MHIIPVEKVTSTNTCLKELAHNQVLEEGTVIVTGNQTAGKGQQGNSWESEAGKNITCSILFYPSFLPVQRFFLLSEIVSLGVKETLDAYTGGIAVKWPNDIYYQEKKIAGILIENELTGSELSLSIAGVGININQEYFLSDAPNPVSLKQITGKEWDIETLLKELVHNILYFYKQLKTGNAETLTRMYHETLYRKTGLHRFEDDKEIFNARIDRVSDDGFLHLITDLNDKRSYIFKSVRFLQT